MSKVLDWQKTISWSWKQIIKDVIKSSKMHKTKLLEIQRNIMNATVIVSDINILL